MSLWRCINFLINNGPEREREARYDSLVVLLPDVKSVCDVTAWLARKLENFDEWTASSYRYPQDYDCDYDRDTLANSY